MFVCSVLVLTPATYAYASFRLRDPDTLRILIEHLVEATNFAWSRNIMLMVIRQVLVTCIHADNTAALESHRSIVLELAREVLLHEVGICEVDGSMPDFNRAMPMETILFMWKISDRKTKQLSFRTKLRRHIVRKCAMCNDPVKNEAGGGRCSRCHVTLYCCRECQGWDYIFHQSLCKKWSSKNMC